MAELNLELVVLSAHDICDWSLDLFAQTLGQSCHTAKVGEEIVVA